MVAPVRFRALTPRDLLDPNLTLLNDFMSSVKETTDELSGVNGPIELGAAIDMQGNRIMNVGNAQAATDALSQTQADTVYGPDVVNKQLSALGSKILQTVRRLNDNTQREQSSTFLNSVASTPPSANTSTITVANAGGGSSTITVPAGNAPVADGSVIHYGARVDTVSNPTSFPIDVPPAGASRNASGVVTIQTTSPHTFVAGQFVNISGITDNTFNGNFIIQSVPNSFHFTYNQVGQAAGTSGNGTAAIGSFYYYYVGQSDKAVHLAGPFPTDIPANRINANTDGKIFIGAARVDAAGGGAAGGGGGTVGTTPPSGCTELGTELKFQEGDRVEVEQLPEQQWVEIETESGAKLTVAIGTLVSAFIVADRLEVGMMLEHDDHSLDRIIKVKTIFKRSTKQKVICRPSGVYFANGLRIHNAKIEANVQ